MIMPFFYAVTPGRIMHLNELKVYQSTSSIENNIVNGEDMSNY